MDNVEAYLKYVLDYVLKNCQEDMQFFEKFVSEGLKDRLLHIIETPFERASYSYAIRVLEKSGKNFEFPVKWGSDLQSEHERYLAEEFFSKPVIITRLPQNYQSVLYALK